MTNQREKPYNLAFEQKVDELSSAIRSIGDLYQFREDIIACYRNGESINSADILLEIESFRNQREDFFIEIDAALKSIRFLLLQQEKALESLLSN